jgi:hypothetical protein
MTQLSSIRELQSFEQSFPRHQAIANRQPSWLAMAMGHCNVAVIIGFCALGLILTFAVLAQLSDFPVAIDEVGLMP